jgi:hypothetical protein
VAVATSGEIITGGELLKLDVDHSRSDQPTGHQPAASTSLLRWMRILLLAGGPANTVWENLLFLLGAASVTVSAIIHLHLWMNGYSNIRTIGPLFLAQSIGGLVLAAAILLIRRLGTALLGLGFLLATIAGFLWSVNYGLFGFQDTWEASFAKSAFWNETIGAILLFILIGVTALRELARRRRHQAHAG